MFHNLISLTTTTLLLLSTTLISGTLATRYYEILNNCPQTIQIFVNGESQGYVDSHQAISYNYLDDFSGYIYSDAGVVVTNGTWHMTRAVFKGVDNYYYILSDHLNTGISIVPVSVKLANQNNDFCVPIFCDMNSCPSKADKSITTFPTPSNNKPPKSPLFSCPDQNTGYVVTFCPSGVFP